MTDMISYLAASIIALINAKPASPTKEEIEKAIRLALPFHVRVAMGQELPWVRKFRASEEIKAGDPVVFDCQGEIQAPPGVPPGLTIRDAIMPLPYKTQLPQGAVCCPSSVDGQHAHVAWDVTTDTYGCRCGHKVDAQMLKATKPQPECRVYKGAHEFTQWGKDKNGLLCMPNDQWDVTAGSILRCQCGAEKP